MLTELRRRGVTLLTVTLLLVSDAPVFLLAAGEEDERARLHEVLASNASTHDKAVACKRLAVVGDESSVSVLAALLSDPTLSHYARFGLEAIPDPSADETLRNAARSLQGRLVVGVLDSLGVRRDVGAIELLSTHLRNSDPEVASAAAAALGKIANEPALQTLVAALDDAASPIRPAVVDACLTAAQVLRSESRPQTAAKIYDLLRHSEGPSYVQLAATLGALETAGSSLPSLMSELLRSDRDADFNAAIQFSRRSTSDELTQVLVDVRPELSNERQSILLAALADRPAPAAIAVLRDAAQAGEGAVKIAAIRGLARGGDASDVDLLMDTALDDGPAAEVARLALESLQGDGVDEALLSQQKTDDRIRRELLIRLVGKRRISGAVPLIVESLNSPHESTRLAALIALGETGGTGELDVLVAEILSPQSPAAGDAAKSALNAICKRTTDRDEAAAKIASLFAPAPAPQRVPLYEILRQLGGDEALSITDAGARDAEDAIQDAATRALGEWLTEEASAPLLALAESPPHPKYKVRALRGYIRLIRQFGLPVEERARMSRAALKLADRDEERKLVLETLPRFPSPESLTIAIEQLADPTQKALAAQVALTIAQQLREESDQAAVQEALRQVIHAQISNEVTNRAERLLSRDSP